MFTLHFFRLKVWLRKVYISSLVHFSISSVIKKVIFCPFLRAIILKILTLVFECQVCGKYFFPCVCLLILSLFFGTEIQTSSSQMEQYFM